MSKVLGEVVKALWGIQGAIVHFGGKIVSQMDDLKQALADEKAAVEANTAVAQAVGTAITNEIAAVKTAITMLQNNPANPDVAGAIAALKDSVTNLGAAKDQLTAGAQALDDEAASLPTAPPATPTP